MIHSGGAGGGRPLATPRDSEGEPRPYGIHRLIPSPGKRGYSNAERAIRASYIESIRLRIENDPGLCLDCWNRRRRCRQGVVYVAKSGGLYKIGMTKCVSERLKALRTSGEHRVVITIPSRCMRKLENEVHGKFSHLRVHGEYFCLSPADLSVVAAMPGARYMEPRA